MNNSWGGLYWTNPAATAPIADEYRPFIFGNDGLVVFATGNVVRQSVRHGRAAQPAGSRRQHAGADLERGWLAVAALDTATPPNWRVLQRLRHGDALLPGRAGNVVVTGTDDSPTSPSYWNWGHLARRAAGVGRGRAGVAGVPVLQQRPGAADLARHGQGPWDAGVDAIYGYGLFDVGMAVRRTGATRLGATSPSIFERRVDMAQPHLPAAAASPSTAPARWS